MSIVDLIKDDHKEVQHIIDRLCGTSDNAVKTRRALFADLRRLVLTHAKAEEKALYQSVENEEDLHDIILESFEEHSLVEKLIRGLEKVDPHDEAWAAKFSVLKENIEHHVEEEEGQLLPKIKKLLSKEELEELAEEFLQFKKEIDVEERDVHKPARSGHISHHP